MINFAFSETEREKKTERERIEFLGQVSNKNTKKTKGKSYASEITDNSILKSGPCTTVFSNVLTISTLHYYLI